jgi:hypothetical protein
MQLSQMQDIGGCRAVLSDVKGVYELRELYENSSRIRHQLTREDDYIAQPKPSGYRSVHRIYRYVSDKKGTYNGLRIEMQIRSRLQHAWATAVETVGTFLEQALKASQGQKEWLDFFILMGSAVAIRENTPLVPGTPTSETELVSQLKQHATKLEVEKRLGAYQETLRMVTMVEMPEAKYFLVELRPRLGSIKVGAYREKDLTRATEDYLKVEQTLDEPGSEAVLVSVESLDTLRRAYPNYFLDTRIFLEILKELIS